MRAHRLFLKHCEYQLLEATQASVMAAGLRVLEEEGTKFFSEEAIQNLVRELGLPPVHPVSRPMPHKFAAGTAGGLPQVRGSPSCPSRDTLTAGLPLVREVCGGGAVNRWP